MTYEQIVMALAELYVLGMRHVSLDGGEPLTHRHVNDIVEFLRALEVRVVMNSNGILVPRRLHVIRRLSKLKISLDGPRDCHDAVRGASSFDKAIAGAEAAICAGVPVEFTCVLGTHNVDRIDELLDFADPRGYRIVFQPARPSLFLDGEPIAQAFVLDRERLGRALDSIVERKRQKSPSVANHWSSLRHFRSYPDDSPPPCAAGWINATLDPEGNLYHCGQVSRADRANNVVRLGARGAFARLRREGCGQCWCARVVEENYAWGARLVDFFPPNEEAADPLDSPIERRRLPVLR
jgi:MoaA/NifB/PqqE/SkfB family radical SAM enzyme